MELTYKKYIEDVKKNKIRTGRTIKLAVQRFEDFCKREDIYLDEDAVQNCILFIYQIRHFLGKSANKNFKLEPFQQFIITNVIGLKYKDTGLRVCRDVYIQVARKMGKDALMAAICLYLMIVDGEAAPEIACLANSRDQARILFEYIDKFATSIDPKERTVKHYRNYLEMPSNKGKIKVFSADASKLDGLNCSAAVIDEYHEAKNRQLYDVIKSSMGMRSQPLMVVITTAGFNLDGPCHDLYMLAIEVLNGVKDDDTFFPFIWQLDEEDDWTDRKNFIKVQPNLGVTVGEDYMLNEVQKAKNDATAEVGVKTKTFNIWCQSSITWIPQELIAKHMQKIYLEDFRGYPCYMGADLGSVGDFTSITTLIIKDNTYYFKTWVFLPNETVKTHPNKELYNKFINQKEMLVTQGNVTDYDFVVNKMREINEICQVQGVFFDSWNATQFALSSQEAGLPMVPFSQSVGNFNGPTKEFERLLKEGKVVIDKSSCVLWQFGNVELKIDVNGNAKPNKGAGYSKKIDSVITIIESLGGYLKNPVADDFDILIL